MSAYNSSTPDRRGEREGGEKKRKGKGMKGGKKGRRAKERKYDQNCRSLKRKGFLL